MFEAFDENRGLLLAAAPFVTYAKIASSRSCVVPLVTLFLIAATVSLVWEIWLLKLLSLIWASSYR